MMPYNNEIHSTESASTNLSSGGILRYSIQSSACSNNKMTTTTLTTCCILMLLASVEGFSIIPVTTRTPGTLPVSIAASCAYKQACLTKLQAQKMTPTRKTRRDDSFDRNDDDGAEEEGEDEIILDYSEAQNKIKEDENKRRVEEGLAVGLTQEDEEEFNAKKDQYEEMRARIRARASEEGFEKSLATKQAIEDATRRAMAGQTSATPDQMLDLSGFANKFEDGTEELTPEEQSEIDKIASMPLLDQLREEINNTRFPTPMAVFQTACLMALIFAVSATFILKGDSIIRDLYTDWGFIPRPDEVYDFSDLELPDGFVEQKSLESDLETAFDVAKEMANDILPPATD